MIDCSSEQLAKIQKETAALIKHYMKYLGISNNLPCYPTASRWHLWNNHSAKIVTGVNCIEQKLQLTWTEWSYRISL